MRKPESCFLLLIVFIHACCAVCFAQTEEEKEIFQFMNTERLRDGIKPLLWDEDLHRVAIAHSQDMADTGNVSHQGTGNTQPQDRVLNAGIYAAKTAENIARDISSTSAHTMLMQSLYHRENILDTEVTHASVGIVKKRQFYYVTELFIHKLTDYSPDEAQQILLRQFNFIRQEKKKPPMNLSESLCNAAQSHAEIQGKLAATSPLLTTSILSRQTNTALAVTSYTTSSLLAIPPQIKPDLQRESHKLGIGFKRIRQGLCTGCYLVVLIFG